jgi:hypothetical protein
MIVSHNISDAGREAKYLQAQGLDNSLSLGHKEMPDYTLLSLGAL